MTCLGKSTLGNKLSTELDNCKYLSLDKYKEDMWDKHGFDSVEQRNQLNETARKLFYEDVDTVIENKSYNYLIIDYVFNEKLWNELMEHVIDKGIDLITIYLKPKDMQEHRKAWELRSRDFSIRHAGHGATHYHNGVGTEYVNRYDTKIFDSLHVTNKVIEVYVSFSPYSTSVSYEDILDYVKMT